MQPGDVPSGGLVWGPDDVCPPGAGVVAGRVVPGGSGGPLSWFTGGDHYMPRVDCLRDEAGGNDWLWIGILLTLSAAVVIGYVKIFVFWRRSYLEESPQHRNTKLMQLAWIFAMCAVCGYFAQIVMFFWPGYRLLAFLLLGLNFWTWRFAANLSELKVSLSAKRLQAELDRSLVDRAAELERQVEERTTELAEARRQAECASVAKSTFLAHMSHEIRTPLTAVLGYAELMRDFAEGNEEASAHLSTILRNGDHLLAIINDVLDLSKIEADQIQIEWSAVELRTAVDEVRELMSSRAAERRIELVTELDGALPIAIRTDALRLRQILLNLVSNAIKFTGEGSVRVRVRRAGPACDRIAFDVIDTGIGMDAEQVQQLFKPFSQADGTIARRFGGTGLGLALSQRLAHKLGGEIRVNSEPGLGSTFTLTIDAVLVANAPNHARDATDRFSGPGDPDAGAVLAGTRILLAEDGLDNQRLIATILRRAGAEVEIADNGRTALETALAAWGAGHTFDVILMDVHMPEMDGVEATRHLREGGYPGTIVALTAHAVSGPAGPARPDDFDGYETKPIQRARLITMCRRWAITPQRLESGRNNTPNRG